MEASSRGIVTQGMQGFDYEQTKQNLNIPDDFDVMAMIATGIKGSHENLPPNLQQKEFPNDRKELNEIITKGSFKGT